MNKLVIYNFPADFDQISPKNTPEGSFFLSTCQRTLVVDAPVSHQSSLFYTRFKEYTIFQDKGYQFLLEVICGLKSKLLGENEIVSQFKEGFEKYLDDETRNPLVTRVLQKLFKDAKTIRTEYLKDIGQYSYAGVTKKLITNRGNENKILLTGSGQLAEDLLKVLHRKFDLHLLARNTEKVKSLKEKYDFKIMPWEDFNEGINFGSIVNTVGNNQEVLFDEAFFKSFLLLNGQKSLFIDLGSPSCISTPYDVANGVIRLSDIFEMSEKLNAQKLDKVDLAICGIKTLSSRRWKIFTDKNLFQQNENSNEQITG
jgi:glutamyl-tRNA reductase